MYTQSFHKYLDRFGDYKIEKITVCRVPLSKAIMTLLNIASKNEFQKNLANTSYDKLYHLFIKIQIDGRDFILEKNEVLSLKLNGSSTKGECLEISIGSRIFTLKNMLDKTQDKMGGKYFSYKAQDNNCQFFVKSFLSANGLGSSETTTFIIQDVSSLFDKDPKFRKLVNTITGIGKEVAENKTIADIVTEVKPRLKKIENSLRKVKPVYDNLSSRFSKINFSI
jgi:hypothetical protein